MKKIILPIIILSLAIALILELSLRFIYFGSDALWPEKMNSHVLILDSDFVQASNQPEIYYELKPNLNSVFRGKHFVTNSAGMPDQEYTLKKPADIYRIAVIGSSWSMGTGVAAGDNYEAVLEEYLQEIPGSKKTEILNFSVEYYSLGEMINTVKYKALTYEPDLIIFAITSVTPSFLWEEHTESFVKNDTTPPFSRSYLAAAIMEAIDRPLYTNTKRPRVRNPYGAFMRQIKRSMESLQLLTADTGIPVAVLWLSFDKVNDSMVRNSARHAHAQGFTFLPITITERAELYGFEGNLSTGKIDLHPNELAHKVIAKTLYDELMSGELK